MALFNEIQVGRLNAVLHKLLSMKEGAPAPQLAADIYPVIALESDRPEYKFLGGEKYCWTSVILTPGVGIYGQVQIWNPAGSGVLAVMEGIDVSVGATATMDVREHNVQITHASQVDVAATERDFRSGFTGLAALKCRYILHTALSGTLRWRMRCLQNEHRSFTQPIILPPGYGLSVAPAATNLAFTINQFTWRERYFEPSEIR